MNGPEDPRDPELDRIYRDAGREEPPRHLDDAILAAARRSVGSGPRLLRAPLRQWAPPIALAATLLLAVTLSLMVFEEHAELDIRKTAQAPASQPDPDAAPRSAPLKTDAPRASAPEREQARAGEETPRRDQAAAEQVAPQAEQAQAPAGAPSAPPAEALRSRDLAQRQPSANDTRTVPSPAPSPQSAPLGARLGERREAAGAVSGVPATGSAASGADRRSPEQWVELIRKLKAEGKPEEVQRELEAFKREYPEYRLPEDLGKP